MRGQLFATLAFTAVITTSCASSARKTDAGGVAPAPTPIQTITQNMAPCVPDPIAMNNTHFNKPALQRIFYQNQNMSLCDLAGQTGKRIVIFQFAGIDCLTCKDESRLFHSQLSTSADGTNIAHVLIATDLKSQISVDMFVNDFTRPTSPNAITAQDDDAKNWKAFSPNPLSPSRPVIVVLERNGYVRLINENSVNSVNMQYGNMGLDPKSAQGIVTAVMSTARDFLARSQTQPITQPGIQPASTVP
jgi:hypothetical protein